MSLWTRISNVFRSDRVNREIDEEIESHIAEAIEQGRDPEEARKAFGSALWLGERSRDLKIVPSLDSLRADAIFGWRQLKRNRGTSAAAILSLGLAIGASLAAFRLIDALLLRPLPVNGAERLYVSAREGIGPEGKAQSFDECEYPLFVRMRTALQGRAKLEAISSAERVDLTYGSDEEIEKAHLQYVSGTMFGTFGIRPALGRLFAGNDDRTPGAHPVAVLSYDYWTHRFGRDPKVIGRTLHQGNDIYEIVGVSEERFTGTDPGAVTGIFVPTMMNQYVTRSDASWFRAWIQLEAGVSPGAARDQLQAVVTAFQEERAQGFQGMPQADIDHFIHQKVVLEPAAAGISGMQKQYRLGLIALGVLVALVLLIACANVANLMTAQAAARGREMALRVSIGAGRWRLVQMVLVESAWLALLAAAVGGGFAWWSAPLVVSMINPRDNPARLMLPADWRVMAFGLALTVGVMLLFGLAPALRVSSVRPVSALKGGENPGSQRRLMHALIAAQVAFCFLVLFVAGLFVATFDRLSHQPTGFSAERLLTLETVAKTPQAAVYWDQVADQLRGVTGVEKVAIAGWPLLGGMNWNRFISLNGAPPSDTLTHFLKVSPGWIDIMKIPLLDGRDFTSNDAFPNVAMVNQTFAKAYFGGESPVGKFFGRPPLPGRVEIVGVVGDALYRNVHQPILPMAYVPFHSLSDSGGPQPIRDGTFLVRTRAANPMSMAALLRREVPRAWPAFRVSSVRTQEEINQAQTVRERLLAMLAFFFGVVALLLAGIGLYGVLSYSVLLRQREIGIRIAVGARVSDIARGVTAGVFSMVGLGSMVGLALGMISGRYVQTLLYQVSATDLGMLTIPAATILIASLLAAVPVVVRAARIDPVAMLRAE